MVTGQQTYQPPPLPNGAVWSPNALPVRFDPTTRQWQAFFNGTWMPKPEWTFEQINAMGRAGQAFQVDFAASGGQANTAAVQREIAPRVFAADNAQLSPEGSILAPGAPRQAVATQQRPNPAVFAPDGAQLSDTGSILSLPSTPATPAPVPQAERGNNPTAVYNPETNTWNVDPAQQRQAQAAPQPSLTTQPPKRQPEDLSGATPPPPRDPNQPPTREQQWLEYLLGSSPAMQGSMTPTFSQGGYRTPRYAEGGSQNLGSSTAGGRAETTTPADDTKDWVYLGADESGRYILYQNTKTGEVRKALVSFAEGGATGPLAMPDAIVGEGLESATPQFDTPERSELTLQPMPNFGPDIFKVRVAEGPTGVQADGGLLVLPLSEPAANIAREHLRPAEGVKGEMNGSQFEAGPLSLPTAPGPGGAGTPAMAAGGFAFDINPPQQQPQQPQQPTFEGVPPLDPSQVQRGVLPPASLAMPSEEWAGLPGGAPPPMGNINDFSRASPAQLARYDQWLKSLGILGGIEAAQQYFRQTAPTRLNLPTFAG